MKALEAFEKSGVREKRTPVLLTVPVKPRWWILAPGALAAVSIPSTLFMMACVSWLMYGFELGRNHGIFFAVLGGVLLPIASLCLSAPHLQRLARSGTITIDREVLTLQLGSAEAIRMTWTEPIGRARWFAQGPPRGKAHLPSTVEVWQLSQGRARITISRRLGLFERRGSSVPQHRETGIVLGLKAKRVFDEIERLGDFKVVEDPLR